MSNETFTTLVIIVGFCIAFCIFMMVRSLGKPVVLPEPKPQRKSVPARQPRRRRQSDPARNQAPPSGRQLAPDDDIEFLRSLDTRPPKSD